VDFNERILSLYTAGYRIKEIAATVECMPSTVRRHLRWLGIDPVARPRGVMRITRAIDYGQALWPSIHTVVPSEARLGEGFATGVPLMLIRYPPLASRDLLGLRTAYLDFTRQQKIGYVAPDRHEFAELYAIAASYAGDAIYRRRRRFRPRHSAATRATMRGADRHRDAR